MRRRRRLMAAVIAALAAGAVMSVLVAWGCTLWSSAMDDEGEWLWEPLPADVEVLIPKDWLIRRNTGGDWRLDIFGRKYSGRGSTTLQVFVDETAPGLSKSGFDHTLSRLRAGWPSVALECTVKNDLTSRPIIEHGIPIPTRLASVGDGWRLGRHPQFPTKPLPGLAFDTVFYALLFLFLGAGGRGLRRRIRTRRGQCAACGYDRAGIAPGAACPECGVAPGAG